MSLSVATLIVSASLFAAADLDSRVRELEKQMKQVRIETTEKTYGANTASARPYVDGHGFFLSFDVFYWQLKAGGTDYCVTNRNAGVTDEDFLPINGKVEEANFNKWDWGFRVGVGYNFDHGDWDIYANYTYYTNSNSTINTAPAVYNFNGQQGITVANPPVAGSSNHDYSGSFIYDKATNQYRFRFNRIDLELGRDFFVDKYLSLRPHVGLMTAWITLRETNQYTGGDVNFNTVTEKRDNSYWGIGPRIGLNTKWRSCNGFGIIGNVGTGLPYGRFDLDYQQQFSLDPKTNETEVSGNMHRFTPMVQMQLGFGYDKALSCDSQHVSMFLAWDIQYWWRVAQHLNPDIALGRLGDDLSLQGVTYHIKWDF
jgi:hypothetical protein